MNINELKEQIVNLMLKSSDKVYGKGSCGELGDSFTALDSDCFSNVAAEIFSLIEEYATLREQEAVTRPSVTDEMIEVEAMKRSPTWISRESFIDGGKYVRDRLTQPQTDAKK